jgi:hypothetical protein
MKTFNLWLSESVSSNNIDAINKIVLQYLSRKVGTKFYAYPGVEQFTNSTSRGYGVRYFYKNKSIRFNWKGTNITSFTLDSVDLWNGTSRDPNWHVEFDDQVSLVKILPMIVDLIKRPIKSEETFSFIPDQNINTFNEHLILEGLRDDPFDIVMGYLSPNTRVRPNEIGDKHGRPSFLVIQQIRTLYPNLFQKEGVAIMFVGTNKDIKQIENNKGSIIGSIGGVKVKIDKGGKKEKYAKTSAEEEVSVGENEMSKITYEEKLEHLKVLLRLVVGGNSNALFVAGRGGTGKTQTVESELAKFGLSDGNGYFKNTGTASPMGIYMTLYNNQDGLILFDDCDSALDTVEGRNLIKAATDTKKIRKISWNKKIVGDIDIPNSFEFTGQIIFISNLRLNKLDPDGALRTRGFVIEINPTDIELIDYMAKIAKDIRLENDAKLKQADIDEVIGLIKNSKNRDDVSLRKLVRGLNVKAALGNDPMVAAIITLYA